MKKSIKLFSYLVCLLIIFSCTSMVYASDFFIVDIFNKSGTYMALSSEGTVFQIKSFDSAKKTIVLSGVASFTNRKDVFLLKNGNVSYNGTEITNLNIKEIIGANMFSEDIFYVNMANELQVYSIKEKKERKIIDNFADIKYETNNGGGIYLHRALVTNTNNELYCWYLTSNVHTPDFETSNLQYVASDVVDFEVNDTEAYYLKNNGELYKYSFNLLQSELIMRDVDIWQGIEVNQSTVLVYANGQFYLNGQFSDNGRMVTFEESSGLLPYECKHGVNDMAIYGSGIYYIGKDNTLYVYHLYSYYAPGRQKLYALSNDIDFKQIYTPGGRANEGLYAVDVNNNLYCISSASTTQDAHLNNSIPNAVPKKFCYENGTLILTEAGECYSLKWGKENISQTCFNNKDVNVIINEKTIELQTPIQIKDGRSMYPLRECFNAMGASVIWDGENSLAIGEVPGIKIEFPIGKKEYYINGVRHEMDTAAYVDDSINRTYIPIRYAAEGLGFTVDWVKGDLENTINIHK